MTTRKGFDFSKITDEDRKGLRRWFRRETRALLERRERYRQEINTLDCRIGVLEAMAEKCGIPPEQYQPQPRGLEAVIAGDLDE